MREIQDLMDFFPYCLLVALPVFIALSPPLAVSGARDFPVHRLAQYEIGGTVVGSNLAAVSMDARSAKADPTNLLRKVVVVRLHETTVGQLNRLVSNGAGAILFLLEETVDTPNDALLQMEEHLLASEVEIPIYFARENKDLAELLADLDEDAIGSGAGKEKVSAAQTLMSALTSTRYQLVSATSAIPKQQTDPVLKSLEGVLKARGEDESQPTVVVIAHYDALGAAPTLARGLDANGSGVIMLLELARIFSRFYKLAKTQPATNLVFLLSAGGKLNYFGSKKFLEDHLDASSTSELLSNAKFCLCLDSLGNRDPDASGSLHLHVSKPPKEDSHSGRFFRTLQLLDKDVRLVHKKINLADERLAWEHERFSIRRLPAMTLSTAASQDSRNRLPTISDVSLDVHLVARNVRILAEALACVVYDYDESACQGSTFDSGRNVSIGNVAAWTDYLKRSPRFAGLATTTDGKAVVATLFEALQSYTHAARVLDQRRDKREPEFNFYDLPRTTMNVHKVKPAVFDLLLTACIAGYLCLVYLLIVKSFVIMQKVSKLVVGGQGTASSNGTPPISDYSAKANGHRKNFF